MIESSEFLYNDFVGVQKDDLQYTYKGVITPKLVMSILDFAKNNLAKAEDTSKMKSRIYYIMGEGLQNITRHQAQGDDLDTDNNAIIVIVKKNYKYYIATGNLMERSQEKKLTEKIEHINKLSPDELKDYSRDIRLTTEFSEKGGASLGLIEMAKRSGNKLSYIIKPIDDKLSYFYLNTEISTSVPENVSYVEEYDYSLDDFTNMHKFLNDNNYILSYKGDFNQENLLSLLSILKNRMKDTKMGIKLHCVMVELLQNIVKHADNIKPKADWKPGIFYIAEHEDKFSMLASNYILSSHKDEFAQRLDRINAMDTEELAKEYNNILFNFSTIDHVTTGLGIIDIRRKCGSKVLYDFRKVDENYNFVTVQVDIKKI